MGDFAAVITLSTTALTAPTGANTIVLFDSSLTGTARFAALSGMHRIEWSIRHDQAGTLQLQESSDGTNWNTVHEAAMAGSATEADTADWYIAPYNYFRVRWVNGGVDQGTWQPRAALSPEASPVQN